LLGIRPSQRFLRRSAAVALLASAALFAVGSHIERSKERGVETTAKPSRADARLPTGSSDALRKTDTGAGETSEGGASKRATGAPAKEGSEAKHSGETHVETGGRRSEAPHTAPAESSLGEAVAQPESESRSEVARSPGAGTQESASERRKETHREAKLLGINPEAVALVVIAVIASALLAAAIWLPGIAVVLAIVTGFGLLFAALDVRELFHQIDESRASLIAIASVLIGLHLLVASLAASALLPVGESWRPNSETTG